MFEIPAQRPHEPRVLLEEMRNACYRVRAWLLDVIEGAPKTAALLMSNPEKPEDNPTRIFDRMAEEQFKTYISRQNLAPNFDVIGEEDRRLTQVDFHGFQGTVFLVDMVDGSDLAIAQLGNWCSAAVCFSPPQRQILAAVVAHADGRLYYASADDRRAHVWSPGDGSQAARPTVSDLRVDYATESMRDAKMCYYGQKWNHVLMFDTEFCEAMGKLGRLYNLAGNPMMAKLADGRIHAVFDISGQKAHDVVPGAYIALKAGAHMSTPRGDQIDEFYLYEKLLTPSQTISYVLAGSEGLRKQLCTRLASAKPLGDILEGRSPLSNDRERAENPPTRASQKKSRSKPQLPVIPNA